MVGVSQSPGGGLLLGQRGGVGESGHLLLQVGVGVHQAAEEVFPFYELGLPRGFPAEEFQVGQVQEGSVGKDQGTAIGPHQVPVFRGLPGEKGRVGTVQPAPLQQSCRPVQVPVGGIVLGSWRLAVGAVPAGGGRPRLAALLFGQRLLGHGVVGAGQLGLADHLAHPFPGAAFGVEGGHRLAGDAVLPADAFHHVPGILRSARGPGCCVSFVPLGGGQGVGGIPQELGRQHLLKLLAGVAPVVFGPPGEVGAAPVWGLLVVAVEETAFGGLTGAGLLLPGLAEDGLPLRRWGGDEFLQGVPYPPLVPVRGEEAQGLRQDGVVDAGHVCALHSVPWPRGAGGWFSPLYPRKRAVNSPKILQGFLGARPRHPMRKP